MDKFESQSAGGHSKEGHEESEVNVRAIVWSLRVVLATCGACSLLLLMVGMIWGMEKRWRDISTPS